MPRIRESSPEDRAIDAIIRASQGSGCADRYQGRVFVDEYILRRWMNQAEIDAEKDSMRTFSDHFRKSHPDEFVVDESPNAECTCTGDGSCLRCCTAVDIEAMPFLRNQIISTSRKNGQEVFLVFLQVDQLEFAGFLD